MKNGVESGQGKQKQGDEIIRMDQVKDNEGMADHLPYRCQNSLSLQYTCGHTDTCAYTQRGPTMVLWVLIRTY